MYGRYTKDLGEYAKDEARKLKILERRRKAEDKARNKVLNIINISIIINTCWCCFNSFLYLYHNNFIKQIAFGVELCL